MKKRTILALILLFICLMFSATMFVYQIKEELFNWEFYMSFLGIMIFGMLFVAFLRVAISRGR
jgi:uncharacterized integral membrane protein